MHRSTCALEGSAKNITVPERVLLVLPINNVVVLVRRCLQVRIVRVQPLRGGLLRVALAHTC